MKITPKMLVFINAAIEERVKAAYPKTGGKFVMDKIKRATIMGIEKQPESVISRALFLATQSNQGASDHIGEEK